MKSLLVGKAKLVMTLHHTLGPNQDHRDTVQLMH